MIKLALRLPLASVLVAGLALQAAASTQDTLSAIHADLRDRFVVRPQGLVLDYVNADGSVDLPDAQECRAGKPNALSWWTPLENGPFLTGLYLDGVLDRWRETRSADDLGLARELVSGLLASASLDAPSGFVARGFFGPERAFYGIGSDDQTGPWFYGLWKYLRSGAASEPERLAITAKMTEVAEALRALGWRIPCAQVGDLAPNQFRGDWSGADYRAASRRLFVARIVHELTRDVGWERDYRTALAESADGRSTRLDLVAAGMQGEWQAHPNLAENHLWIYVVSQAMVRELHALETDARVKAAYLRSLEGNAALCAPKVAEDVVADLHSTPFRSDWRSLNSHWRVQRTPSEASTLALEQLRLWANGGRWREIQAVREPACAAWIVFLSPTATSDTAAAALRFERFLDRVPWTNLQASSGMFAFPAGLLLAPHRTQTPPTGGVGVTPPPAPASPIVTRGTLAAGATRCTSLFQLVDIPAELLGKELHTVPRGSSAKPGAGFSVRADKAGRAWLLVMDKGNPQPPPGWSALDLRVRWNSGSAIFADRAFTRSVSAGETILVPPADGVDPQGVYAIPHALVLGPVQ